jgi:ribosomal-protein-alanine N-acetyltransferase
MEIETAAFSPLAREHLSRPHAPRDTDLFVADAVGRVVGYAACWTVVDQSELGNVAVDEAARGRGIGGALVDAVVRRVRERGALELFWRSASPTWARSRCTWSAASR